MYSKEKHFSDIISGATSGSMRILPFQ